MTTGTIRYWWSAAVRRRRIYHRLSVGLSVADEDCKWGKVAVWDRMIGNEPPPNYQPCKRCFKEA